MIPFQKFHGTGNDFILIDHTKEIVLDIHNDQFIKRMCSRRFGIGADGLMVVEKGNPGFDFNMLYFNADGSPSTMCGNGGRCITMAARLWSINDKKKGDVFYTFSFGGDTYYSELLKDNWVSLKMQDLSLVSRDGKAYVLDTGSPHFVDFVEDSKHVDVVESGSNVRFNDTYREEGINVNFISVENNVLTVRTYERGVEDETFSCGTGVVASALALSLEKDFSIGKHEVDINTLGGELKVEFVKGTEGFRNIYLKGPVVKVFEGVFEVDSKSFR